ncbi:MAG: bacillithiol transferase BstA [Gemmatimonadetes bacterium]|nr:bacillithiol transferase BstA [Gemmatimonadota bacterium]
MHATLEDLRYPVGRFDPGAEVPHQQRSALIDEIAAIPARLRAAVAGLSDVELDTPYRDGGWTVRQVVHHVPDSHMNAYMRFKLALTEENPPIKTYEEKLWAELIDARTAPPEPSLQLLEALHLRWVMLLRSLGPAEYERSFRHPEWGPITLGVTLRLYEWHGRHHVAHITSLRKRMGWH